MVLGLGLDLVDVARFERDVARHGCDGVVSATLRPAEVAACLARPHSSRLFAARFAAKEALLKALGTGLVGRLSWYDMEVSEDDGGRARLALSGEARTAAERLGVKVVHLSLSHAGRLAAAAVVLEG